MGCYYLKDGQRSNNNNYRGRSRERNWGNNNNNNNNNTNWRRSRTPLKRKNGNCFYCGGWGHFEKDCWKKKDEAKGDFSGNNYRGRSRDAGKGNQNNQKLISMA